jgi:hypothetical protein
LAPACLRERAELIQVKHLSLEGRLLASHATIYYAEKSCLDKRTSLLRTFVNYGRKKAYNIGPRATNCPQVDEETPKLFAKVWRSFEDEDVDVLDDRDGHGHEDGLKGQHAPDEPSKVTEGRAEGAEGRHCHV